MVALRFPRKERCGQLRQDSYRPLSWTDHWTPSTVGYSMTIVHDAKDDFATSPLLHKLPVLVSETEERMAVSIAAAIESL